MAAVSQVRAVVSALGVARLYTGLVDVVVIDEEDTHSAAAITDLGMDVVVARTVMATQHDRERLTRARRRRRHPGARVRRAGAA